MDKKLPKVFASKVSKDAGNNRRVFDSSKEIVKDLKPEKPTYTKNINQKINDIFSSSRYVYKADVKITLKDGVISKRIVGKNNSHLITIDNELIPIADIKDIEYE